jgi:hypothetical protein
MHADEKDDDEEISQVPQAPTSLPEATSSSKPSYKVTLDELVRPFNVRLNCIDD